MELYDNALTSVERAVAVLKTYPFIPVGISFDDPDVLDEITRLINYWSSYIEQATNTQFGLKTYTEFYKGTNQPTLMLKHYPVKELKSIEQIVGGSQVVGTFDIEQVMLMMSQDDLDKGLLYIEPRLMQRSTTIGIVPETYTSLRSYKIVYDSGYVLPKDETAQSPTDLPPALEGLVLELVKSQFISNTDAFRANNLIGLTEGNVQRLWAPPTEFKLTESQKKIISLFKRKGI